VNPFGARVSPGREDAKVQHAEEATGGSFYIMYDVSDWDQHAVADHDRWTTKCRRHTARLRVRRQTASGGMHLGASGNDPQADRVAPTSASTW